MATDDTDLPKLAAPARRALIAAGYTRLEQLTEVEESEVMRLHGLGSNAMKTLRNALRERGLSFRGGMVGPA
jgi:DNA-directed RNA polymerase alpha subunit